MTSPLTRLRQCAEHMSTVELTPEVPGSQVISLGSIILSHLASHGGTRLLHGRPQHTMAPLPVTPVALASHMLLDLVVGGLSSISFGESMAPTRHATREAPPTPNFEELRQVERASSAMAERPPPRGQRTAASTSSRQLKLPPSCIRATRKISSSRDGMGTLFSTASSISLKAKCSAARRSTDFSAAGPERNLRQAPSSCFSSCRTDSISSVLQPRPFSRVNTAAAARRTN